MTARMRIEYESKADIASKTLKTHIIIYNITILKELLRYTAYFKHNAICAYKAYTDRVLNVVTNINYSVMRIIPKTRMTDSAGWKGVSQMNSNRTMCFVHLTYHSKKSKHRNCSL